jgi:hypothetical protein
MKTDRRSLHRFACLIGDFYRQRVRIVRTRSVDGAFPFNHLNV